MAKILHISESLTAGVLHCVTMLANGQVEAGHDVTLIHSVRADTPSNALLDQLFNLHVDRITIDMKTEIGLHDVKSLISLFRLLIIKRADIIHLHSSKAGALGRIVAFLIFKIGKTYYSPHGFSFLRQDVSKKKQKLFLLIEKALHTLGGKILACSATEKFYAEKNLKSQRSYLLENAVDFSEIHEKDYSETSAEIKVVTSGRISYQKAPWNFSRVADVFANELNLEFIWIGDGDSKLKSKWIGTSPVKVSGWLRKNDLLYALAAADIFLFPSLWEGMPIALIEAQASGIPAVATNIVGNKDIIIHGETGFLANTTEEIEKYLRMLLTDSTLRKRMGMAARAHAMRRFNKEIFLKNTLAIYFDDR